MPRIRPEQLKGAYASSVVEELNLKFLTDAEKSKLSEITQKGSSGVRRYAFTTATLTFTTVTARDYRTAAQTVNFPEALPNEPTLVIARIVSDLGIYGVTITSKSTTQLQFKINTPLSNTSRAFSIEFIVLL